MQTILDTLNKLREEQGLPPLEAPQGYTNENDFGSLAGSFGIGAGRMINDVALGGGGATLGNSIIQFILVFVSSNSLVY